jgi:streptogrisin C
MSGKAKFFLNSSAAFFFASAIWSTASAQQPGRPDESVAVQTADEALAMDSGSFARDQNIAADEAGRRLRLRLEADERLTQIRTGLTARYAGGYITHSPSYGVVLRLTGAEPVAAQKLSLPSGQFEVRYETGAAATLETLARTISDKLAALKLALPDLQGAGVDERTGEIVLKVYAVGAAAAAVIARAAEMTALVGQPVRIETVAAPARPTNIRGGTRVYDASGFCTGAFVGQTSTYRALLTAGHCNNNLTFLGNDGVTTYAMTYVSEVYDADQDVQYHRSATAMLPEFWADTNVRRTLTGRRLRTSTFAGDEFCHNGQGTGYSCGLVTTTTHAPTFSGACGGQTCSPVWINLEGANLRCYPGDSGGPVFVSTVAAGVQSSASWTGSGAGGCVYMTYMSTDYLPTGVSLLYGP